MEALLVWLEATGLAQTMRRSTWLYPTANVLHVMGVMGLFAAVAAMDVRAWRAEMVADLVDVIATLRPVAGALLALQVVTGILLFLPEASHIGHNPALQFKLLTIVVALGNVVVLERAVRGVALLGAVPGSAKAAAAASIVLWLAVAALGRLIAYF